MLGHLPLQLAAATAMVALTIMVHLGGLAGLIALLRRHDRDLHTRRAKKMIARLEAKTSPSGAPDLPSYRQKRTEPPAP
jgi:hypothetical protein